MAQKFNTREIVISDPKKSSIDMTSSIKGTGKLGRLIPIFSQELIPNSTIHYTPNTLARFVPLAAPLMSGMSMRHHVIAIPFRQLYADWETFITGGEFNTDDSTLGNFTLSAVYEGLNDWLGSINTNTPALFNTSIEGIISRAEQVSQSSQLRQMLNPILDQMEKRQSGWNQSELDLANTVMAILINMTVGTGSIMDYCGYPVRDYSLLISGLDQTKPEGWTFLMTKTIPVGGAPQRIIVGLNAEGADTETIFSDAYLRAYFRAWYYYFRDQNLDIIPTGFTPEEIKKMKKLDFNDPDLFPLLMLLRPVCWQKDLFNTSTLQAYENNAFVPVSEGDGKEIEAQDVQVYDAQNGEWNSMRVPTSWISQVQGYRAGAPGANLIATDGGITGFSLKNLQKVEALSKWLDKNLYGGWTYADQLNSHFGIKYSDARMQLPEYVGGTKQMVDCQTLTNNTSTDVQLAGDQAGYAQGITANDGVTYFAEEHCIIMDFLSIVPELSYKYATPKHLFHLKKFDFAFPEFAQLGCDIIPSACIANSIVSQSDAIRGNLNTNGFGYADRYFEYKSNVNRLCGKLVDDLPLYTFTQDYNPYKTVKDTFSQLPTLNADFVHCVPSTDCFVSDSPEYEFVFDHSAAMKAQIPLPVVQYV